MRTALLAAALALAGCNLTYDREGVKFEPPSVATCAARGLDFCQLGSRAYCASLTTDRLNCGACGNPCGIGVDCRTDTGSPACGTGGAGYCGAVSGESICGIEYPVCVDTNSDPRNCGYCGNDCGTQSCVSKVCTSAAALTVVPLFPNNGADWNDWVVGTSYVSSIDTACNPGGTSDCVHAGEFKAVYVTGKNSCMSLSITESLGAFEWFCDGSTSPVRFVTSGLKAGVGLGQLIDSTTPAWRPNYVTVYDGGVAYAASSPAAWWSNPVAAVPASGILSTQGTIYVAPADVGTRIVFSASKTALVGPSSGATQLTNASGYTIVTDGVAQRDHLWLEGGFQQASTGGGVQLWMTRYSRIRDLSYGRPPSANSDVGLYLLQASRVQVSNLTANGTGFGVYLDQASNGVLDGVVVTDNSNSGVQIENSNGNVLTNVTARQTSAAGGQGGAGVGVRFFQAADNVLTGIRVAGYATGIRFEAGGAAAATQRNRLTDVTVAASGGDGLLLGAFTTGNVLRSVRTAENGGNGLTLQGATANTFIDLLTVANGGHGIDATNATDNRFSAVTTSRNQFWGIWFRLGASNNVLMSVLSQGNWSGIRFTDATANLVSDLASTDQTYGLYAEGASSNQLHGTLVVGFNPGGDCFVAGAPAPGFDAACNPLGASNFQLTTGVTLAAGASVPGGFFGPTSFTFITDLDDNTAHDWFTFVDPYSAWVRRLEPYGRLGCSNAANRTQLSCTGGPGPGTPRSSTGR